VGGGDSAIESALMLSDQNKVTISYRSEAFSRIKPLNSSAVNEAAASGKLEILFNTNLTSIDPDTVSIENVKTGEKSILPNNMVYIFAGGELPSQFLEKTGIRITRKFGEAILKH
jgi:thioredoxin reductase